ncbi:MAG: hypothetical protein FWC20_00715 [Oscillospiraceae bacterium]|nr:hypothetical protein [Oscillospiraceae bacterium]MCL2277915.1 hypothetical protein [Oscillospiraceae bacterium]
MTDAEMEEFVKIIECTCIGSNETRARLNDKYTLSIWRNILDDYSSLECFKALKSYIKKSKYVPHISEIVKEIEDDSSAPGKYGVPTQNDIERMHKILEKIKNEEKVLLESKNLLLLTNCNS